MSPSCLPAPWRRRKPTGPWNCELNIWISYDMYITKKHIYPCILVKKWHTGTIILIIYVFYISTMVQIYEKRKSLWMWTASRLCWAWRLDTETLTFAADLVCNFVGLIDNRHQTTNLNHSLYMFFLDLFWIDKTWESRLGLLNFRKIHGVQPFSGIFSTKKRTYRKWTPVQYSILSFFWNVPTQKDIELPKTTAPNRRRRRSMAWPMTSGRSWRINSASGPRCRRWSRTAAGYIIQI